MQQNKHTSVASAARIKSRQRHPRSGGGAAGAVLYLQSIKFGYINSRYFSRDRQNILTNERSRPYGSSPSSASFLHRKRPINRYVGCRTPTQETSLKSP